MDDSGLLCLACVDLDHLAFRPSQKYLDWFNIRPGDVIGDNSSAELQANSYARNQPQPGAGPAASMKLKGEHRRRTGEGRTMKGLRVMLRAMSYSREINRLAIDVDQPYKAFCRRYEAAVPAVDGEQLAKRLSAGADWVQVVADAAAGAPYGFLRYWKFEATALMALAGNRWHGVEYLIGNHTVLEQMYRYDPCALLYGPLRTVIYVGPDERTRFAFDQPSTCFSSFADADIARIGIEIDRKLARLLKSLDVQVGSLLDSAD